MKKAQDKNHLAVLDDKVFARLLEKMKNTLSFNLNPFEQTFEQSNNSVYTSKTDLVRLTKLNFLSRVITPPYISETDLMRLD